MLVWKDIVARQLLLHTEQHQGALILVIELCADVCNDRLGQEVCELLHRRLLELGLPPELRRQETVGGLQRGKGGLRRDKPR